MNKFIQPLRIAFCTLTVLPLPTRRGEEAAATAFRLSLVWFPVVGAFLGGVLWIMHQGLSLIPFFPAPAAGFLLVVASVGMTGAIHIDGLADVCDGFGGGRTRERVLAIFKDSSHGTFGVTAIVLDLLAKIWLYGFLVANGGVLLIVASIIVSRSCQAAALACVPSAGAGTGSLFCGATHRPLIAIVVFLVIGISSSLMVPVAAIGCVFAIVLVGLFVLYCIRRIGGVTGDCIGALSEIAEIAVLSAGFLLV